MSDQYEGYEETFEDVEALMSEPPDGHGHGKQSINSADQDRTQRNRSLDVADWQAGELYVSGGFSIAWPGDMGTKGNRSVLSPDEYVDQDTLAPMVEEELGFTLLEVRLAYGYRGYQPPERRALRKRIDARIVELYEAGANMYVFAEVIGMNQRTMNRVLERAQKETA